MISVAYDITYLSLYHGSTCAAGWRGLGAPGARCSTSSSHAIADMLAARVQLNSDGLNAAHGLVALAAARVVHRGRFVVIIKSRLAASPAAGCEDSSIDLVNSESKMDSSWKLARRVTRRQAASTVASST